MKHPSLSRSRKPVPIKMVAPGDVGSGTGLTELDIKWADSNDFDGQSGRILTVSDENGQIGSVLFGIGNDPHPMITGKLASGLPEGNYSFVENRLDPHLSTLGWLLGSYQFTNYNAGKGYQAALVPEKGIDEESLMREVQAVYTARDLINTPANDLGPAELEKMIRSLGRKHKASVSVVKGDDLLKKNFPMVHAVGRASTSAPRLMDLKWGNKGHPKVTLVGKGVVFDTGGLNIKPGNSMALMKKDMGGAANVIALAGMIMEAKLPIRLRLLVPAVENAIAGNAFRPGDVLPSRKGLTVEIGNTDAEGRLILADALALADEESPQLLLDMATLTGAARVALGPDLPPFYCEDPALVADINAASIEVSDPLWHMPLWQPYQKMLTSKVADVNHISTGGFAGSITAALFLSRFVENASSWCHLDIFGWVPTAQPWAPVGGEAQGIRALYNVISQRYPV